MLVYGDTERLESVETKRDAIQTTLDSAARLPPGLERHAALVSAFISMSELVQGIVDAEFEARGFDARSPSQVIGMNLLGTLAQAIARSWRSHFKSGNPSMAFPEGLSKLDAGQNVRTRRAEGYAFYALYPECYLEAALRSGLDSKTQVIGIRSIGIGLGAMVSAALMAPPPLTLRPVGHPFCRKIRVDPGLNLPAGQRDLTFAIVDEGPGLSGSSFGAVADWLESEGVPQTKIHFFPSHAGDLGPRANQAHRARWSMATRHTVPTDRLLLHGSKEHSLATWVEGLIGPLDHPLEELSGGAWRRRRYESEQSWPAANIRQERLKYLARAHGEAWLVKFIGLDETSARKVHRARQLHQAGFAPEVAGHCYGFMVERWHDNARPLASAPFNRWRLVEHVGAYLGYRARHFSSNQESGARLKDLRAMALHNTQLALGKSAAGALAHLLECGTELEGLVHRVDTDNRMHLWEWQALGGRFIKTDALDHSSTHDLVGHQDIAWDVAGAVAELSLSGDETSLVCRIIETECHCTVHPELLAFLLPCYLAFQMGVCTMAAEALDGAEAVRLRQASGRYADLLAAKLSGT